MSRTRGRTSIPPTTTTSSRSTRRSGTLWDPRTVLGIDSDPRCSGENKRGTRCGNTMISGPDRQEASIILKNIARMPPDEGIPLDMLEDLAFLTLCPRWHRRPGYSQVDVLAYKWEQLTDEYCATVAADSVPRRTATRLTWVETRTTTSQTTTTLVGTRTAGVPQDQPRYLFRPRMSNPAQLEAPSSLRRPSAQLNAPFPGTVVSSSSRPTISLIELPDCSSTRSTGNSGSSRGVNPSPQTFPVSRTSIASDSTARSPTSSTILDPGTSATSTTAPAPSDSIPTEASTGGPPTPASPLVSGPTSGVASPSSGANAIATPTSPPAPPALGQQQLPSPPLPPPSSPPRVHRPGLRRGLSASSTCPICFDPIASPSTATFCRAQCGMNVHTECFAEWRNTCFSRFEAGDGVSQGDILSPSQRRRKLNSVTCVYCRSIWQWDWEDLMNDRQALRH